MVLVGIINVIAYCIFDYSVRIFDNWPLINHVSVSIEIICNIVYSVDMVLQVVAMGLLFERGTYLRSFNN
jgi:hypothetical protein